MKYAQRKSPIDDLSSNENCRRAPSSDSVIVVCYSFFMLVVFLASGMFIHGGNEGILSLFLFILFLFGVIISRSMLLKLFNVFMVIVFFQVCVDSVKNSAKIMEHRRDLREESLLRHIDLLNQEINKLSTGEQCRHNEKEQADNDESKEGDR